MISLQLARELQEAGLRWRPAAGDRFTIDQPELVGDVFTVAEMTVQAHRFPSGTILGFNGTTEWALDAVTLEETVWLPREDQLRELLGATFRALHRRDGEYLVATAVPGGADGVEEHAAPAAADAYAKALLALIARSTG
ncbi:pilus assembly protein CpaE [Georgenia yuyongxinii]|uniref:Pilus assembly protein CpaE n=1 Tax=Georgenia yuyongxinii TaxID=2589797 RepID=A0A552WL84_9MICO|nr:pilus assembly protein CpaE [Georgenia yuyongxinii]TRW43496.1 pilus assembly protein CpaE [Georgenia yuyongxinii]